MSNHESIHSPDPGEILRQLVESADVELSQPDAKGERKGLCPFHDDTNPSLSVNLEKGVFHCFACDEGGGPAQWLILIEGLSYTEALGRLRELFGYEQAPLDPEAEANLSLLDRFITACHDALTPERREQLHKERSLSGATIDRHRLGYCRPDLELDLSDEERSRAQQIGLQKADGSWFPAGRLTIPYLVNGRPAWLTSRAVEDGEPRYLQLPNNGVAGLDPSALYVARPAGKPASGTVVVEGPFDALAFTEAGHRSVAVGTRVKREALVALHQPITICTDDDDAGRAAADQAAAFLLRHGVEARLVAGLDGAAKDPSAYLAAGGDLTAVVEGAMRATEVRIANALEAPAEERSAILAPIFDYLAINEDVLIKADVRKRVNKALDLGMREIEALVQKAQYRRRQRDAIAIDPEPFEEISGLIHGALDLHKGVMTVGVANNGYRDGQPVAQPFIVSSDATIMPVGDPPIVHLGDAALGVAHAEGVIPTTVGWDYPDASAWCQKPVGDLGAAIADVTEEFNRLVEFQDPGWSTGIGLWVALTYLFSAFPAVPYLHVRGPRGSGKTKIGDLTGVLAHRPVNAANATPATLFRLADAERPTFILDEMEHLGNRRDDGAQDVARLLNSGYKAGQAVLRMDMDADPPAVRRFDVFGPKMVISIRGLPDTTASRCLAVHTQPTTSEKARLDVLRGDPRYAEMRSGLYRGALAAAPKVWAAREDDLPEEFTGRYRELWRPLWVIGRVVDPDRTRGYAETVLALARAQVEADREDLLDDLHMAVIGALHHLVETGAPAEVQRIQLQNLVRNHLADDSPAWGGPEGRLEQRIGYARRDLGVRSIQSRRTYVVDPEQVDRLMAAYNLRFDHGAHCGETTVRVR